MQTKYYKSATKKNIARKKAPNFVYAGKSKLRSRLRKMRLSTFRHPHAITISTKGHPLSEIEFLQDAEAKGFITNVTWIRSIDNGIDESIRHAIIFLHTEEAKTNNYHIQKQYDYAWIKMALDHGPIPSRFSILKNRSTPSFVRYIQSLGFTDIAGSKTLNKELSKAFWDSLNRTITFPKSYVNILERKRRNRIAFKFLEILNEI